VFLLAMKVMGLQRLKTRMADAVVTDSNAAADPLVKLNR
jgi:hypothetical protein